jgi:transcriptional regulator with XRE-family HTH domain
MKVKLKKQIIRRVLAKKNLSQNWLAIRVQTTSGYMSQLIRGIRTPSPEMRQRILNVLRDYQFDDLFIIQN